MDLNELKQTVGLERFDAACACAWQWAPAEGKIDGRQPWPDDLEDVPHELSELWYEGEEPLEQRLAPAFELYRQMPCYANTMYIRQRFHDFDADLRERFWTEYRKLFSSPHTELSEPVAYSLWCDYLEDSETVGESWRQMTYQGVEGVTRERLMRVCGPVPWHLKAPLLVETAASRSGQSMVLEALSVSAFDIYGDIDVRHASRLLDKLQLNPADPGVTELRDRLAELGEP